MHPLFTFKRSPRTNIALMMGIEFFAEFRLYYAVQVLVYQFLTGSFALAMSVFSVTQISSALFEIPTGLLSDKMGRRKTLILGSACEFLSMACLTLSFSSSHSLIVLYLSSIFLGAASSFFSGNNEALAYESLAYTGEAKNLSHALGKIRSTGQAALCSTSLLASLLLWFGFSFYQLALFTLIPMGISFILSFFIIEPPHLKEHDKDEWTRFKEALFLIIHNRKIRLLALANILRESTGHASHSFLPAFVNTVWPLWLTSAYRVGQNLIGVFSFWFAGHVICRTSPLHTLLTSTVYSNFVSLVAYVFKNATSPLLVMSLQFFYALRMTANATLQQENFSDDHRATMGSLISFAWAIMTALSLILVGFLADKTSPATALIILLLLSSPSGIIYLKLYKERENRLAVICKDEIPMV